MISGTGREHPEWLPVGWKVRVKVRSCGKKDKYYVNPSNDLKFNSKPEVLRYLGSSEKDNNTSHPDKKVDESLSGDETGKSDLKLATNLKCTATNNVNSNHLEQREGNDSLDIKTSDKPQLANIMKLRANRTRETKKLVNHKVDKSAAGDQLLKSGTKAAPVEKTDARKAMHIDDPMFRNLPNKPAQVKEKDRHIGGRRQSKRLAENKLKDNAGSDGAEERNVTVPETKDLMQSEKEKKSTEGQQDGFLAAQNKKPNSKRKWADLPRRTSKRLAHVEADPSREVKMSVEALADASGLSGEAGVETTEFIYKAVSSNEAESDSKGKNKTENPINDDQKRPSNDSDLSSPDEHKYVGVDCKDNIEKHHLDSALNDLLMDPCIEFAIKTLTGAIPFEEMTTIVNNSPTSSLASHNQASASTAPSVDIWADPCFEFAVKTLTGDVPMENRNSSSSQLEITFQQPLSSPGGNSLTLPKFRLDSIYPSNYSFSQSDAVKKPYM